MKFFSALVLMAVLFVLGLSLACLAFLCFELYWPGSALRVYFCEKGSMKHHTATFKYTPDGIRVSHKGGFHFKCMKGRQLPSNVTAS